MPCFTRESTFLHDLSTTAKSGHSTAQQAAILGNEAGVHLLVLGHLSSRYRDENRVLEEAQRITRTHVWPTKACAFEWFQEKAICPLFGMIPNRYFAPMQGIFIVIADSSPVFRHGLEQILLKRGNDTTVVHAESGEELQAVLIPNAPDLVIIDCMAPKFSVDDVLACQRVHPGLKMLAITAARGQSIVHALRAGITSFVKKDCGMEEVLEAIDETSAGGTFFCGQILAAIEADSIPVDDLSPQTHRVTPLYSPTAKLKCSP